MVDVKNRLIIWNVCACFWLFVVASGETKQDRSNESDTCSTESWKNCMAKAFSSMNKDILTRMPVSEEEIASSCSGFNAGMKCYHNYAKKCLKESQRKYMDSHTSGAKKIFHHLCNEDEFRKEYLQHKTCLKATQKEWESCGNQFRQLMREIESEDVRRNATHDPKMLEKCCAVHGFKGCVYVPSRLKCYKDSALFIHRLAELSIDSAELNVKLCQNIVNSRICVGCANKISVSVMTLSYLFLRHYC